MLFDLSEIYVQDILIGDILYHISNDLFHKVIRVEVEGEWLILYSDAKEFSWAFDKTEKLDKAEFKLYREREIR